MVVIAACGVGGAGEGAKVEDTTEEWPAVWDVGDKDGRAGFTDIPEGPYWVEGFRE